MRVFEHKFSTNVAVGLIVLSLSVLSGGCLSGPEPLQANSRQSDGFKSGPNYNRPESTPNQPVNPETSKQTVYRPSDSLKRDVPYRVVLPADYLSSSDKRFPVVYLLHGLTGHYNDWTDRTDVAQLATKYNVIIVTPEGGDGWYSDSPVLPQSRYESYLINELIPEIDRSYRTYPERKFRFLAGLSMGGYGAVKFGLKYPNLFAMVGSFSGAFGIAKWTEKKGGNSLIGRSIDSVFGPVGSEARRANDVFEILKNMKPERTDVLPYIYISCGTEDSMIEENRALNKALVEKKIKHDYSTRSGGHDWVFWGGEVQKFLELCSRMLKTP